MLKNTYVKNTDPHAALLIFFVGRLENDAASNVAVSRGPTPWSVMPRLYKRITFVSGPGSSCVVRSLQYARLET